MKPHYADEQVTLYHGDCVEVLASLPESSVDSVCTDPPYGISFMGQQWDQPGEFGSQRRNGKPGVHNRTAEYDHRKTRAREGAMEAGLYDLSPTATRNFQTWCTVWATECYRVLKPGGYLVSFGGARTWHRLATGIEDAGFEMRDSIAWLFGSGFPKSLDVSKAIDRAAGAGRDVVGVHHRHGGGSAASGSMAGPLGTASDLPLTAPATATAKQWQGWGTALKPAFEPIVVARKPLSGTVAANVLEHGTGALNIDACRVGTTDDTGRTRNTALGVMNDDGWQPKSQSSEAHEAGRWPTNVLLDEAQAAALDLQSGTLKSGSRRAGQYGLMGYHGADAALMPAVDGDEGGASRFFPVFRYEAKAPTSERPTVGGTAHPTVKPLDLMRWLVRLVTPPNGLVLEPFAGSGTTAEACIHEHLRCIAIEREADYLPLITARLTKPIAVGFDFGEPA